MIPAQTGGVEVRVLDSSRQVTDAVLECVRVTLAEPGVPLVSFATGATFAAFFARLAEWLRGKTGRPGRWCATHLDEYLGFGPDRPGGMVYELVHSCPPFEEMLHAGAFVPVPYRGEPAELEAHGRRLEELGGVSLQLLGIGRNGHVAFNEPGTDFDLGFHVARLAPTTREDVRARFVPHEPPEYGVTAGPRDILAARRIVLAATGPRKAAAVRAMLRGPIGPVCPATVVRLHPRATVLLDREAAAELELASKGGE